VIEITPVEVIVLKKLVLINHALAAKIAEPAASKQKALVRVLNEITLRADADCHSADSSWGDR
jgi:hypothetical protein